MSFHVLGRFDDALKRGGVVQLNSAGLRLLEEAHAARIGGRQCPLNSTSCDAVPFVKNFVSEA